MGSNMGRNRLLASGGTEIQSERVNLSSAQATPHWAIRTAIVKSDVDDRVAAAGERPASLLSMAWSN